MRKQLLNLKRFGCQSVLALCAVLLAPAPALADIWGFVDEKGATHFAAEQLDARYELYFKRGQNFDTKEGWVTDPDSPVEGTPAPPAPATATASSVSMPRVQGALPVHAPAVESAKVPSRLHTFFDVSPNFKAVKHLMRDASNLYQIDFELLQALIATESGFDTAAVSPKGAVGLMQLMPPTAQRFGVKSDAKTPIEKKLTDPKTNIAAGTRYLSHLIHMFPGQLELALAAYNAGEGAVKRYGNQIPPYKETQNYVKTILQMYATLKPPALTAKRAPEVKAVQISKPITRVQMVIGGAVRRGNMVPPTHAALPTAEINTPDKSTLVLQALPGATFNGVQ